MAIDSQQISLVIAIAIKKAKAKTKKINPIPQKLSQLHLTISMSMIQSSQVIDQSSVSQSINKTSRQSTSQSNQSVS